MPIYPVGGNKGDAFSRTNGSRCRYTRGKGEGAKKRGKTVREAERVCHSAVRRSIKSVWLSALRRYGVIIRWQFYRKRSSRQIAPSILLPHLCSHVDSSSFRLILALSYMNSGLYFEDLECRHSLTSARSSNFNSSLMTINIFRSEFMWKVKESRNNGTIRSNLAKLAFYDIVHGLIEDHKCLSNENDNRKCKQKEVVNYVKELFSLEISSVIQFAELWIER